MRKHSSDLINTYSFSNKKNKFWDRRKVYSLKGYPPLLIKEVENTGGNL
jgi:hypothetical protein